MNFKFEDLYIYKYLDEILDAVEKNNVILIKSPTGTGKSLGIPKALNIIYPEYRIFISVPTIAAVINLFNIQKYLSPYVNIGYAADSEVHYNDKSKVVYCTTGHLRKLMLKTRNLNFCDVLMLDEAHTGTIDNSIVMSLCEFFDENKKIIISSATLDLYNYDHVKKILIDIPTKKIITTYHDKNYELEDDNLYLDTAEVIQNFHNTTKENINFLVFVSGRSEITKIINNLKIQDAEILELTGDMDTSTLEKIFLDCPEDKKRKIIITTNVAESSVTINDIGLVIDTMIEKIAGFTDNDSLLLKTSYISKSSAIQRKGRTGRTRNGICYRMCTEFFYEKLIESRELEINRIPLHTYMLELLKYKYDPATILHEIKDKNKLIESMDLIKMLKLYDEEKEIVTDVGNFVVDFPIGIRTSVILYKYTHDFIDENNIFGIYPIIDEKDELKNKINRMFIDKKAELYPIIVCLCIIDCFKNSYFYIPRFDKEILKEEYIDVHFSKYLGDSDLETNLNWYVELSKEFVDRDSIKNWCVKNSFNNKKVIDLIKKINKIMELLYGKNIIFNMCEFNVKEVIENLKPYLIESYYDKIVTKNSGRYLSLDRTNVYFINKYTSFMNMFNTYNYYIGVITNSSSKNKRVTKFINFCVSI